MLSRLLSNVPPRADAKEEESRRLVHFCSVYRENTSCMYVEANIKMLSANLLWAAPHPPLGGGQLGH